MQSFRNVLSLYPRIMNVHKNKAILCFKPEEPKFSFSLTYENKQFNMSRNIDEKMDNFMNRFKENIRNKLEKKKNKKKKLEIEQPSNFEVNLAFSKENQEFKVLEESIAKDFLTQPGLKFHISESIYDIVINPPIVYDSKLPEVIMANYLVYPFKLKLDFAELDDCDFSWFVSDPGLKEQSQKSSWTLRNQGYYFQTSNEDIDKFVKLIITPKKGEEMGEKFIVISPKKVTPGPGTCPYEQRHAFTKAKLGPKEFRVVTYNLLADLYADSDFSRTVLHPQCPAYALAIDYRKSLFTKELLGYNADIMCLQEVDNKIYDFDLQPLFFKQGFDSVFDRKGGQVSEGVATFWNKDKYDKIETQRIVLAEAIKEDEKFKDILEVLNKNEKLQENFLKRTTALQIVTLICKDNPGKGIVIGTTHLFFKPDADHIRLLQIAMVMRELEAAKKKAETDLKLDFHILLCGDFNSTPPFGVLEFVRQKVIQDDHADWKSKEEEHVQGLKIEHPFNMESACGTPKYTTYTIGFKDCIDYIYYQKDAIEVTNVVPFPLEEEMEVLQGLPNVVFPSDHIACVADLKWK